MRRDDQRAPVVTGRMIILDRRSSHEIRVLPAEIVVRLIGIRRGALNVVLVDWLPVPDQRAVTHLERVTGDSDDSLHIIEPRIYRVGEYDHIAAPRGVDGRELAADSGDTSAVDQLVDEQEVTLEQGVLHAAARDLECLHAKRADDDEERQRDNDDLGPVREKGKFASSPPAVRGTE